MQQQQTLDAMQLVVEDARELATGSTTLASNWTSEMWIRTRWAHNIQFKFNVMVIPVPGPDNNQVIVIAPSGATAHMVHSEGAPLRSPDDDHHRPVQFVIQLFMYIIIPPQCTSHALCCPIQMRWWTMCVERSGESSSIDRLWPPRLHVYLATWLPPPVAHLWIIVSPYDWQETNATWAIDKAP